VEARPGRWALPGVDLDGAVAHFVDGTADLRRFEGMMDGLELGNIRRVCNELNFPTVYCPWGCSTFLQDVGGLDLAAVFHHLLRKRRVKVIMKTKASREALSNCLSMRADYLDPRHPKHLLCPELEVRPCVGLHKKLGMCVLTCSCHSGGTPKRYYHVPRSPFGLMSSAGNQLAHCVVHHRTVKPMAPKKFNNTYQLFMQRGSFSGIGMSCLKSNGDFSLKLELLAHGESLSIACRDDIRGLLGQLEDDGHIDPRTATNFRETSDRMHPDGGARARELYSTGATYTLYMDCMKLQKELATAHQVTVARGTLNGRVSYETFTPVWLRSIVWVHPADCHGALFYSFRGLFPKVIMSAGLPVLYVLLGVMTTQPCLWDDLAAEVRNAGDWSGQMLVFATKVFPYAGNRRSSRADPFKGARHKKAVKMAELLQLGGEAVELVGHLRSAVSVRGMAAWTRDERFRSADHGGLPSTSVV